MKLIGKDAVVAEVEKRYEYLREKEFNSHSIESEIRMSECQHLMLLLNTLEVKEVDFEKEMYLQINKLHTPLHYEDYEELKNFAKHFYELGLKSQNAE